MSLRGLDAATLAELAAADLELPVWEAILAVETGHAAAASGPAVLGSYRVEGCELRFTPRFPPLPGLEYRARFDPVALARALGGAEGQSGAKARSESVERVFETSAAGGGEAPRVVAIYPSADRVPENLLRIYVEFSRPMKAKNVARHVRLEDEAGRPVAEPFVEIPDGLWDPSGRRLTLLVHPGRIKRGVGPHEVQGPPLAAGRRYRLVVDAELTDAAGTPLAAPAEKAWIAGPADRVSPDPGAWRVRAPVSPGAPLTVELPEPLDHALLGRLLTVRDAAGRSLAGEIAIDRGERRWSFTPAAAWAPGAYRLAVAPGLEDLAGNTPERLFDRELDGASDGAGGGLETRSIPFSVPSPAAAAGR